jgi:outer membrane autotransporter protein
MPTAQISYFYSGINGFNENSADDLDLHVQSYAAQTMRTQLAMILDRVFNLRQGAKINAGLLLGYAHNFPMDNRVITASLPALGGTFTVNGYKEQANEALIGATLSTKVRKKIVIDAQYNAVLSHAFNSQTVSLLFNYYLDA